MIKQILITAGAAGVLAGVSLWNYRRFMPKPRSLGPETHEVDIRPMTIPAGEHRLYGELLLPKDRTGPVPMAICCHGFGSSYKLCRDTMGKCFAMSGLGAFCFDFYGGSKKTRSGGTMEQMSIFTEQADLDAVIDAVAGLPEVDAENLFLLGESQGGCVSGITAPQHTDQLRAMVLYYPAFNIPENAQAKYRTPAEISDQDVTFNIKVGRFYNEKLLDYDVYEHIAGFDRPVLILHGDADETVDIKYGRRAAEVYPDAVFVQMPGETHGFTGKGKLTAAEKSYHFFLQHMKED